MHACVCIHVYVCTYVLRKVVFGDMEQVKEFNAGHSRYVKGDICSLFLQALQGSCSPQPFTGELKPMLSVLQKQQWLLRSVHTLLVPDMSI